MPLTDDEFVDLVERCTQIVEIQNKIKERMSNGIFGMTIARHSGVGVSSLNCREDMDASVSVAYSATEGTFELFEKKPSVDPLLLISALPPPALKKSQKHFRDVVLDIMELANIIGPIHLKYGEYRSHHRSTAVCADIDGLADSVESLSKLSVKDSDLCGEGDEHKKSL